MDSFDISPVHTEHRNSGNLRDDGEEKQRLEKLNFDLKMKVYYLEESLRKVQHEKNEHSSNDGEVTALKLLLEEKNIELEQRNMLLLKAKGAIEALKGEIQRLRNESGKGGELEERVRKMKHANESAELEYRSNFVKLENELSAARQSLSKKEELKTAAEDKASQLEVSLALTNQRLSEIVTEKARLEERLLSAQQKIKDLQDDLTQSLAHIDIHKMELHEMINERDDLQSQLQDLHISKQSSEEHLKGQLSAATTKYEAQVKNIQQLNEQSLEKLRQENQQSLESIRQQYQTEVQRARSELDRKLTESKSTDSAELSRIRSEFSDRLNEKIDEIKVLRSLMEADRAHLDGLMKESEALKGDQKLKSEVIEHLRIDVTSKEDELKLLRRSHDENTELKSLLQREQVEKAQLTQKLEQTAESLTACRESIEKQQSSLSIADREQQRLSRDLIDYRAKGEKIDEVSRENERLRATAEKNRLEIQSLSHKTSNQDRDITGLRIELATQEEKIHTLTEELSTSKHQKKSLEKAIEDVANAVQNEKTRVRAADAALQEQRGVTESLRGELNAERSARQVAERNASKGSNTIREMREEVGRACLMSVEAMHKWDSTLSILLDGDLYDHLPTSSSSNPSRNRNRDRAGDSPRHVALHDSSDGEDNFVRISGKRADLLPEEIAVQIERLNLKFERVSKIRQLFDIQSNKMIKAMQSKVETTQERLSLSFHTIAAAQSKTDSALSLIQRDRKNKDSEAEEMRKFREEILTEHNARLRDAEMRLAQLTQVLEQEKRVGAASSKQAEDLRVEVTMLSQENHGLREDLQSLTQTERIMSELTVRMGELADANRATHHELEERRRQVEEISAANRDLVAEKAVLATTTERYESILRSKDNESRQYEERINKMSKELDHLRERQMHPDLEHTIRETQSLLQGKSYARGINYPDEEAQFRMPTSTLNGATSSSTDLGVLIQAVDRLVKKSSEMLSRFESWHQMISYQNGVDGNLIAAASSLSNELFELLEMNSQLTLQVQQLAMETRRIQRRNTTPTMMASSSNNLMMGANDGYYPPPTPGISNQYQPQQPISNVTSASVSPTKQHISLTPRPSSTQQSDPYRSVPSSVPATAASTSANVTSNNTNTRSTNRAFFGEPLIIPGTTPVPQHGKIFFDSVNNNGFDPVQSAQPPLTSSELYYSSSNTNNNNYGTSKVSSSTDEDLGESIQQKNQAFSRQVPSSTTSEFRARLQQQQQQQQQQSRFGQQQQQQQPLSPSAASVVSYRSTASASASLASRQSSRLNRLGSDLQNLAKKLDTFDSSGRVRETDKNR